MKIRSAYLLGFIAICVLLFISFYLQFYDGFNPCPLCVLQRVAFIILGILFLMGIIVYKRPIGRKIINVLSLLTALLGAGLAGRQVWLQHFPPQDASECGVSIQYMLQVLPANEVVKKILAGSAECTKQGWQFFYLNMAEWSLVFFVLFFIYSIYLLIKE
jgi:disulfide bond formation protein DsbB